MVLEKVKFGIRYLDTGPRKNNQTALSELVVLANFVPLSTSAVLLIPQLRLAARRVDANTVEPAGEGL